MVSITLHYMVSEVAMKSQTVLYRKFMYSRTNVSEEEQPQLNQKRFPYPFFVHFLLMLSDHITEVFSETMELLRLLLHHLLILSRHNVVHYFQLFWL